MTPHPRPDRIAGWVRALLTLAVTLPLTTYAFLLARSGWRSDTHGLFLSRVLFAKDRGQLELLGFEYPPLPFLLLLPWPTDLWAILLGSGAIAVLCWMLLDLCRERRSMLPLLLFVVVVWSPFGVHLVAGDFNEAIGLAVLYAGWRQYRLWWETRRTIYGLYTGLWLGLAFYTSPLGLALALIAGAILPLTFPRLRIPPFASQLSLLVFPGFAASATWAYLAWVFTHRVALPLTPWESGSPLLGTILLWTIPYLLVTLLALLRPAATTGGMLLPLLLFLIAGQVGWHFSLAYAVGFLTLVAIVALPHRLGRSSRALLTATAAAQLIAAWWYLPTPTMTESDQRARAVAEALASTPPRSVLLDDRRAAELLKWAPSLAPYLTTRDMGFDVAYSEPHTAVQYVLVMTDADGVTLDAERRPPPGFVADWSWGGYILYRHPDAPRRMVQYSLSRPDPAGGSN